MWAYVLLLFHIYLKNLTRCRQTNDLNIYPTDLRQIFTVGRTIAVDKRSIVSFSLPQGTLPWQPMLRPNPGPIHRNRSRANREMSACDKKCKCCADQLLAVINRRLGWLGSRVVSVLDSGTEGPGFKSQSRHCRVTVLGKLFNKQQNW